MFEAMSWSSAGGTDDTEPTCSCGCSCSCSCDSKRWATAKSVLVASGGASANAVVNSAGNPVSPLGPLF